MSWWKPFNWRRARPVVDLHDLADAIKDIEPTNTPLLKSIERKAELRKLPGKYEEVFYKGAWFTFKQLSVVYVVPAHILRQRIKDHNWSVEDAINTPVRARTRKQRTVYDYALRNGPTND
jgi:hypothetical protein